MWNLSFSLTVAEESAEETGIDGISKEDEKRLLILELVWELNQELMKNIKPLDEHW
jgi:hypothetical protein